MHPDAYKIRLDIKALEARMTKLEADSHSPMPYVTCSECWCLVAEESWDKHASWHEGSNK